MNTYPQEIPAYIYCHQNLVTGKFYFGYRMKNIKLGKMPAEDLPKYITSSKIKADILANPHEWHSEILQEFFGKTSGDDAFWAEQELIKRSWGNSLLLNEQFQDKEKNHKVFRKKLGPTGPQKNSAKPRKPRSDKGISRSPTGPTGPRKKIECRFCKDLFGPGIIGRHEIACEMNPDRQKNPVKKGECRHCRKLIANNVIGQHEITCEMNPAHKTISKGPQKKVECRHCQKLIGSGSIARHEITCEMNPKRARNSHKNYNLWSISN